MGIGDAFRGLIQSIIGLLPSSPFAPLIDQFRNIPFLGYLNWFFPVRACLIVMTGWLAAIALFYIYSVVMRWVKLIGD